jgi:hypothetical protein
MDTMDENLSDLHPWRGKDRGAEYRELVDIARLAFIYGVPSYEMARVRFRFLHQPRTAVNSFRHQRECTTPSTARVTNANADVLKSTAWLDLSRAPLLIHVPDAGDRYCSLALMDFFTNNFAVLGRRAAGTAAGDFLLAGPQWDGAAPAGVVVIRAPTNSVWALARTLVYGPEDLATAHVLQDQFAISRLRPTSQAAPRSPHPLSRPVEPLGSTNLLDFFEVLNAVLTENPPLPQDKAIVDRLKAIGVGPSLQFRRDDFKQPELDALQRGIATAWQAIRRRGNLRVQSPRENAAMPWPSGALLGRLRGSFRGTEARAGKARRRGWRHPPMLVGNFSADYLLRARSALRGIGALPREEAMYFVAETDSNGAQFGSGRYVLRFAQESLPPVDAYWSLTAYQVDKNKRLWLVPNPINRYSLGNHTTGLRRGADGSLKILIQHQQPSVNEENWLPVAEGRFLLTLGAYLPRQELLDGRYAIPDVEPLSPSEYQNQHSHDRPIFSGADRA